jgi:hypothetical protein
MPQTVYLETEPQYFAEIKKWRAWKGRNGRSFWLTFRPHDTDEVLNRLRAPSRKAHREAHREKIEVRQDHYFVLTNGYNNLVKYTRRGYQYSFAHSGGRRFRTKKEAKNYRKSLVKNNRYKAEIWKVERINLPATFLV